mmetsp:Transcript_73428/g.168353  ORF Transcript_73428/g.168353 Transcript_73428/m.168353 type:complete len:119 (+) Transcript_73428:16-372(+)
MLAPPPSLVRNRTRAESFLPPACEWTSAPRVVIHGGHRAAWEGDIPNHTSSAAVRDRYWLDSTGIRPLQDPIPGRGPARNLLCDEDRKFIFAQTALALPDIHKARQAAAPKFGGPGAM